MGRPQVGQSGTDTGTNNHACTSSQGANPVPRAQNLLCGQEFKAKKGVGNAELLPPRVDEGWERAAVPILLSRQTTK